MSLPQKVTEGTRTWHTGDATVTTTIDAGLDLESFLDAYITAALWSSNDEGDPETGGEPIDANYDRDDLTPEALARMTADCERFLAENGADLLYAIALESSGAWCLPDGAGCTVLEYAGHDFWMTRNGHGCGFWDGDWIEAHGIAGRLDAASEGFGECGLYVTDDGRIDAA